MHSYTSPLITLNLANRRGCNLFFTSWRPKCKRIGAYASHCNFWSNPLTLM